ncbi:MAG: hypothetical protein AUG04_09905 [Deltaproteobacteria bacterium 13_1_20CM_2_69_21]|nr:MAG: hypothetical protein AUI90_00290 [Deltaproteobacteria bacterium 13_1_40CM_3_69_14]OLD34056.1 MAG: hypothetical protein AUI19_03630 [Myxococcales bacterium 13_1_40CM_2_68_15]OLE62448.1 MAG: hypothetical protein AUG04_09905 [Deltaproteobacteria bacterium 13_1_20CM_2_69_21]HMC32885.1 hypothetical protein [Myxococcales bacterium]
MKRILVIAAVAAACGGSSGTAVDHNRAGSGSSTLLVTGTVTVTVSATAPLTSFSVTVKDGLGANVSGATVTVHNSAYGDVALTEAQTGSGVYTGSQTSYPSGDLSLSVVNGADKVQGVVVGYPGTHAINAPASGATVAANAPLHVSWTTPTVSKAATISLSSGGFSAQVPDTGAYDVPAASNPARTGQRVTIVRSNEVDIGGGLPGSSMKVTVSLRGDTFTAQ